MEGRISSVHVQNCRQGNENKLRSKCGAFDPAKRDSNDLLASLGLALLAWVLG